MNKAVKQTNIE